MNIDRDQGTAMTSCELFLASFEGNYDDEAPWEAVRILRRRNTEEVFQLASGYCRSETPKHRARALDVLAQLGAGMPLTERPHFSESVSIALMHLGDEDSLVVNSAAWALAHLGDERAVAALIEMRNCPDAGVRWAVARGVAGSERPEAINTLIELMDDSNDDVRNWATFGLGAMFTEKDATGRLGRMDSGEIREALRSACVIHIARCAMRRCGAWHCVASQQHCSFCSTALIPKSGSRATRWLQPRLWA